MSLRTNDLEKELLDRVEVPINIDVPKIAMATLDESLNDNKTSEGFCECEVLVDRCQRI